MAASVFNETDLNFFTKSSKATLVNYKYAESLIARSGKSVREVQNETIKDRVGLAKKNLQDAEDLLLRIKYRGAIGRGYYSMYHLFRAVSFAFHEGDDFEQHSKLPQGIPADFPTSDVWKNNLKTARLKRNKADYEPYPKDDLLFEPDAVEIVDFAREAYMVGEIYLTSKGIV